MNGYYTLSLYVSTSVFQGRQRRTSVVMVVMNVLKRIFSRQDVQSENECVRNLNWFRGCIWQSEMLLDDL